jgi:hypothetical protein
MKDHYDFSKGEKGKFFKPNVVLKVPIYLDAGNQTFVSKLAKKKKGVSEMVNTLIRSEAEFAKVLQ